MKNISILLLAFVACAPRAGAATLSEYGVSLTATGLVDHVTQLRWLDSALTDGGLAELQGFLDAGWRLATEEEFTFLASREPFQYGGTHESELNRDEFITMMTRLSVDLDADHFAGVWVCRPYGAPEDWCSSTTSFGGQFVLDGPYGYQPTEFGLYYYLTEVPIYGAFDCHKTNLCTYMGRSLLVRAVPLPAAGWLLIVALCSAALARRR